jgi:hypothetical protein
MTASTIGILLLSLGRFGLAKNYGTYASLGAGTLGRSWNRVSFLDLFLSDVFITLTKEAQPQFSTLFLNGAAHLQHHYMLNSPAYANGQANPSWYIGEGLDPVGDIYAIYDRILGSVQRALPDYRVLLATGLHQDPHGAPEYYWRLRNHAQFLTGLGLKFDAVQPRMSRDFVVRFASRTDLEHAASTLTGAVIDGARAFSVEKRETDIFIQLVFPKEITEKTNLRAGGTVVENLKRDVVFVALKNGHHSSIGYFSDSGRERRELPRSMPLTQVYHELLGIFRNGAGVRPRWAHPQQQPLRERI